MAGMNGPGINAFWGTIPQLKNAINAGFKCVLVPYLDDPVHWGNPNDARRILDALQGRAELRMWVVFSHYWKPYQAGERFVDSSGTEYAHTPCPSSAENIDRIRRLIRIGKNNGAKITFDCEFYKTKQGPQYDLFQERQPRCYCKKCDGRADSWEDLRAFFERKKRRIRGQAYFWDRWIMDLFGEQFDEHNYQRIQDTSRIKRLNMDYRGAYAGAWLEYHGTHEYALEYAARIVRVYGDRWWWWSDQALSDGTSWVLPGNGPPNYPKRPPFPKPTSDFWAQMRDIIDGSAVLDPVKPIPVWPNPNGNDK